MAWIERPRLRSLRELHAAGGLRECPGLVFRAHSHSWKVRGTGVAVSVVRGTAKMDGRSFWHGRFITFIIRSTRNEALGGQPVAHRLIVESRSAGRSTARCAASMPEERDQDDDRDRHSDKPKKN